MVLGLQILIWKFVLKVKIWQSTHKSKYILLTSVPCEGLGGEFTNANYSLPGPLYPPNTIAQGFTEQNAIEFICRNCTWIDSTSKISKSFKR